ncbi:hypothetical protein [Methylorubrum extorquens]|jgi:hypothetical protein|uniref:Uncharacterized protein n=1 Tax=Methylorubrum extorquens (strain CM4 / NCIMB 13688) TaxID=440085 RepID=B7KTX0_METC4|nr:hypothetical protein [Methylorubrum extorquens]ACK84180.1 hypothetical protein Mchl_3350 [Methylorubrum extorquens CM4]
MLISETVREGVEAYLIRARHTALDHAGEHGSGQRRQEGRLASLQEHPLASRHLDAMPRRLQQIRQTQREPGIAALRGHRVP